jgi:hypothetical protein
MLPLLLGLAAGLKGIGSVIGGAKQAGAAKDAARIMTDYGNRAISGIDAERQRATGAYSPYTSAGGNAITTLGALMTPGQRVNGGMVSPTGNAPQMAGRQPMTLADLMQSGGRLPMPPQMPQGPGGYMQRPPVDPRMMGGGGDPRMMRGY